MMDTQPHLSQLHQLAGSYPEDATDPDSLIGFFQNFRPDGLGAKELFTRLDWFGESQVGAELDQRLASLFDVAGNDRRPDGGRDAYFVVRHPESIESTIVEKLATEWLGNLSELAIIVGDAESATTLDPPPHVRVLEGIPPKHPRKDDEKTSFLKTMQHEVPSFVDRIDAGGFATMLRPAYYFVACDTSLRDYLMWPLYAEAAGLPDPFLPYFQLWKHGVKYRIFQDSQIDFYMPRQSE